MSVKTIALPLLAALALVACNETKVDAGPTPAKLAAERQAREGQVAAAPQAGATQAVPANGTAQAPAQVVEVSAEARAEADAVFQARCVACHGPQGRGEGPTAAALNPKPRNFHDAAFQKAVDDAHLRKVIVGGGIAVGKSPLMPPNPDLEAKPQVIEALVQKIRAFGQEG